MPNYSFEAKRFPEAVASTEARFNFDYQKPLYCPVCDIPQDGKIVDRKITINPNGEGYFMSANQCTRCSKLYLEIYQVNLINKNVSFSQFCPSTSTTYNDPTLESLSFKFIDMYQQALRADAAGDKELAATGYRSALEFLVKDYAISELNEPSDAVQRKTLHKAIATYLDSKMASSADVIRILGNDFTHYKRKYPEYDFELLKEYMEIFIKQVRVALKIAHPPVGKGASHIPQGDSHQNPSNE